MQTLDKQDSCYSNKWLMYVLPWHPHLQVVVQQADHFVDRYCALYALNLEAIHFQDALLNKNEGNFSFYQKGKDCPHRNYLNKLEKLVYTVVQYNILLCVEHGIIYHVTNLGQHCKFKPDCKSCVFKEVNMCIHFLRFKLLYTSS